MTANDLQCFNCGRFFARDKVHLIGHELKAVCRDCSSLVCSRCGVQLGPNDDERSDMCWGCDDLMFRLRHDALRDPFSYYDDPRQFLAD